MSEPARIHITERQRPMAKAELNFLEFIQSFRRGELLAQGDTLLNEMVDAINQTGGSGCLTIKIPFKVNKAGQLECDPSIEMKKPRPVLGTGIYYATDDGRLSQRDPRQTNWVDDLDDRRMRD